MNRPKIARRKRRSGGSNPRNDLANKDKNPLDLIIPHLPLDLFERGRAIGAKRCLCRYYSSDFYLKTLEREFYALTHGKSDLLFYFFQPWDKKYISSPRLIFTYKNSQQMMDVVKSRAMLNGDYIGLGIYILGEDNLYNSARLLSETAAALRMIYGHHFVRQLHAELMYSLDRVGSIQIYSPWTWNIHVDRLRQDFGVAKKDGEFDFVAKDRTLELLEIAHSIEDPSIRLIQLWLAIESQIGGGPERISFVKMTGSDLIDSELNRLRILRGDVIHESKRIRMSQLDEYSLLSIIRIACLRDGQLRNSLIRQYEEAMLDPDAAGLSTGSSAN